MSKIQGLLNEYGETHQNSTNKLIHWICVPAIFFSLVGLFSTIPNQFLTQYIGDVWYANWATVVLIFVLVYYLSLSVLLTLGMAIFGIVCLYGVHLLLRWNMLPVWLVSILIFAVAWVFQFIGHHVEGKKPSFLKDVQFLLIGPAWLMHFIYKKIGLPY